VALIINPGGILIRAGTRRSIRGSRSGLDPQGEAAVPRPQAAQGAGLGLPDEADPKVMAQRSRRRRITGERVHL